MTSLHQQLRDRIAQAILGVAVPGVLVATVIAIEASYFFSPTRSLLPCWIAGGGALLSALFGWRGRPHQGTAALIYSLIAAVWTGMWMNGGVQAPAYLLAVPLVVLVATVHGQKWAWIFTGLITLVGWGFLYASQTGHIGPPPEVKPQFQWMVVSVFTGVTAIFAIIPSNLLRRTLRELERSNEDLKQFAYLAAHDLQEPTRMIMLYLQLIENRNGKRFDADTKEYFSFVLANARRMQAMVRSVLDFSCIGAEERMFAPVDTQSALDQALKNLAAQISQAGAVIDAKTLPVIVGSEPQLIRLFQNLVSNAVKFRADRPPVIEVAAERIATGWIFSVSDNGIGIPAEAADKLFVLFQRLHHQSQYPGEGIGLAVCKKIVSLHDGRIWFEMNDRGGTTFKFFIPDRKVA